MQRRVPRTLSPLKSNFTDFQKVVAFLNTEAVLCMSCHDIVTVSFLPPCCAAILDCKQGTHLFKLFNDTEMWATGEKMSWKNPKCLKVCILKFSGVLKCFKNVVFLLFCSSAEK